MTRVARLVAVAAMLAAGCPTDLLVGEAGDTDAEGTSTTQGPPDPTGDSKGDTSTTGPVDPDPSASGTTTAVDPSEGSSTGMRDPTTTGETTEGSTTGEPVDCTMIDGIEGCQMHEICIWLAEPGECTLDPCFDKGNDCWAMEFAACSEVLACAWNSENPEVGDCAPISCVPCGLLTGDQCLEVEGCVYNEPKMLCVAA